MSTTKLFVGNLPFSTTEEEVRALFQEIGEVQSVNLINDRETGRPRGFGFVELSTEVAQVALREFDGMEFNGRTLRVNEARERERRERPFRGGDRGDRGDRGGDRGHRRY
ncbi:MAG: RNA-binding protein [Acidobacteria bacterium]|nr:RNA-binding protein [Acidobacteriota bacterium]